MRRRVLFVIVAVALIVGVHVVVDDLTRQDWNGADDKAMLVPDQEDPAFGAAGVSPVPPAAAPPAGGTGMDPAMQQKARQLQQRYSNRLSKMSTSDKMRALDKVRALLGSNRGGTPGR